MIEGKIRPLVLCIIKHQGKLLVTKYYDSKKEETFYRLLGGGIDFGEYGKDALVREFQEELATGLENIKYLTTIENVFVYNGNQGHEITLIYEADLADKELYQKDTLDILDSKSGTKAFWQNISDFKEEKLILYPEGVAEYL